MGFATLRGIRFVIFTLIPLGVFTGWVIKEGYDYFKKKQKALTIIITVVVFIVTVYGFIDRAHGAAKGLLPLLDDNWNKVLNLIKEKTPADTIINSWWDFGDWFKTIANRRVIFDGQSQDTPQAYWMAKAILSNNENESLGILRMLNSSGNRTFEIINDYVKDPLQSVLLLESIIVLNPEEARLRLSQFLSASAVEAVIKNLFSKTGNACFIVDPSMVPKMPAISYLGNWNFPKIYIVKNFNKKERDQIIDYFKKLGKDSQLIQKFYQEVFLIPPENLDPWLSNRLQFYGGAINGEEKEGAVFFDNGFIYNLKERAIYSNISQIPRSLFILNDENPQGGPVEIPLPNANVSFSAMIGKAKGRYKLIFLDRELAGSLFVRLYFFDAAGYKHFIPLIESQEGDNYIRVFKIEW